MSKVHQSESNPRGQASRPCSELGLEFCLMSLFMDTSLSCLPLSSTRAKDFLQTSCLGVCLRCHCHWQNLVTHLSLLSRPEDPLCRPTISVAVEQVNSQCNRPFKSSQGHTAETKHDNRSKVQLELSSAALSSWGRKKHAG